MSLQLLSTALPKHTRTKLPSWEQHYHCYAPAATRSGEPGKHRSGNKTHTPFFKILFLPRCMGTPSVSPGRGSLLPEPAPRGGSALTRAGAFHSALHKGPSHPVPSGLKTHILTQIHSYTTVPLLLIILPPLLCTLFFFPTEQSLPPKQSAMGFHTRWSLPFQFYFD